MMYALELSKAMEESRKTFILHYNSRVQKALKRAEQKRRRASGCLSDGKSALRKDCLRATKKKKKKEEKKKSNVDPVFEEAMKSQNGFNIVEMEDDGNCLFRAFAHQDVRSGYCTEENIFRIFEL